MSDWGGDRLREDKRWRYGVPPVGNANYAWIQHFIHHLAPNGTAGFVLANGSMSSNTSGEARSARRSSRRIWWIAWWRCLVSCFSRRRFLCVCGFLGAAELEEDDEPFEEKMARLTKELEAQFEENAKLEEAIRENLKRLGDTLTGTSKQ